MSNIVFKVIVIGNSSVGKTAFVKSYVFEKPNLENSATVGVEFMVKTLQLPENSTIKVQVWDIGGQDRSAYLMRAFCNRAHGCVLLFDVTNPATFESVTQWKREIEEKCLEDGRKPIPCILLANKCDLNERSIKLKDIDKLTEDYGFIGWKEVSVKEGLNVQEAMMTLVKEMARRYDFLDQQLSDSNGHITLKKKISQQNSSDKHMPHVNVKWQNNCC